MAHGAEAIVASRWFLEIDGITEGYFREISGLDSKTEVVEHHITLDKTSEKIIHKIPGNTTYSNITLRRGMTDNTTLYDWRQLVIDGKIKEARKSGTLTLVAPDDKPVAKFSFEDAWPCSLKGPAADASKNELFVEELELAVLRIVRQKV